MTRSVQNAAGKSTSGWLDRLRKSKGIPAAPYVDLDHFITHLHNDVVPDPTPTPAPAPPATAVSRRIHQEAIAANDTMFNRITNVLADLFVMRGKVEIIADNFPKSKCSQKQPNPKFCGSVNSPDFSCANNSSIGSNEFPAASEGDNSVKLLENEDEEEKSWSNLSGFSRTEVTVIDTSCSKWKFEKMLFKKENAWRVRDKKGKGGHIVKKEKKRKADDLFADEDGGGGGAKKPKEEYQEGDKSQSTSTMASANYGKPVKKKKKHVALNLEKGSSSALIKNIPEDKKVSTSIPRNKTSR